MMHAATTANDLAAAMVSNKRVKNATMATRYKQTPAPTIAERRAAAMAMCKPTSRPAMTQTSMTTMPAAMTVRWPDVEMVLFTSAARRVTTATSPMRTDVAMTAHCPSVAMASRNLVRNATMVI